MNPGSVRTFYQARRVLLIAAVAAPVLLLAGVWWLVTQVLMVPSVPDGTTVPEQVAHFIMHAKGLPRLTGARREAVFEQQLRRLVKDETFRAGFLAAYRRATPEEQTAFREHLFDAIKPLVLRDFRHFEGLSGPARREYLDERIVAYNRMRAFWGDVRIGKEALGGGAISANDLLQMVMSKTTEEERQTGIAYAQALGARVTEILADPQLKQQFEARIADTPATSTAASKASP